tara:strand:+ start:335 stop:1201 length:867 start_codon:yes stop_codon:yes gene_type:complete
MKTTTKIKSIIIIFLLIIAAVIISRYFIGLHFKKKFSVRPAPNVIVTEVKESIFYKSIETFGTAIAQNSKIYRVKKREIVGSLKIDGRFVKTGDLIATLKDNKKVIADFNGKLGKREIAQGVLGSDSLIITLDDLKKIVIDIKVPENYVGVIKKNLKAKITSTAFQNSFSGKIESVSSRVDPSTRSILARVIVNNENFKIIPGQLMTVKIVYDEKKQMGVPESSVTVQGKNAFVYVVKNNIVERRNITTGKRNFGKVSVLSGISVGEKVVSEGVSKIRDKTKVKIISN